VIPLPRAPGETDAEVAEERNYAPAIYGSLLVTSLVAIQWRHNPDPDGIALTLVIGVVVFWLAHAWSEIVNRRILGRITRREVLTIASNEGSMLTALVLPALVLAVGPRIGMSINTAIAIALVISIGQLFLWGLVVGRAAHHGWVLPLIVAVVDVLLGVLIVALKIAVLH
jgi:hypothetical protein